MSVMEFFRTKQPTPPTNGQPAPGQPGQAVTPATPGGSRTLEGPPANVDTNANQGQPTNTGEQKPSLDDFKNLWEDEQPKDGEQPSQGKPKGLNVDPKRIRESAAKLDFSKVVDPALVTKALAGDAQSFISVLNSVGQAGFANAMHATLLTVNKAMEDSEGRVFERLPSEVRKHTVRDSSLTNNPKLNHPAIRPMLEMVQQRIADKYPDATTAQVQEMAKEYLTKSFEAMGSSEEDSSGGQRQLSGSPKERIQQIAAGNGGMNWETYLDDGGRPQL